jgi:hypothetical protein
MAGWVIAPRLKIHCPKGDACAAQLKSGATNVTLTAQPRQDASGGQYKFDKWVGQCEGSTAKKCAFYVDPSARTTTVKAVFSPLQTN